ncbi:MAG: hypothetical protein COV36_02640 [Alphaproteobacteria bacterium CG11_big_fil_rev_8_21_14_0_20_44_7]|nr:MAG: hypothetical protein COV36_02640 [Alphaproteobacteria bacterium CG11_big_fil_rev_8_21_14_0_20_44_7]
MRKILYITGMLLLAACNQARESDSALISKTYIGFTEGLREDTVELRADAADFLYPEADIRADGGKFSAKSKAGAGKATASVKTYCYKSIAEVTCYKTRLPGQDYRLVGTN